MPGSPLLFTSIVPAGDLPVEKSRSQKVEKSEREKPKVDHDSSEGAVEKLRKNQPARHLSSFLPLGIPLGARHGVPARAISSTVRRRRAIRRTLDSSLFRPRNSTNEPGMSMKTKDEVKKSDRELETNRRSHRAVRSPAGCAHSSTSRLLNFSTQGLAERPGRQGFRENTKILRTKPLCY